MATVWRCLHSLCSPQGSKQKTTIYKLATQKKNKAILATPADATWCDLHCQRTFQVVSLLDQLHLGLSHFNWTFQAIQLQKTWQLDDIHEKILEINHPNRPNGTIDYGQRAIEIALNEGKSSVWSRVDLGQRGATSPASKPRLGSLHRVLKKNVYHAIKANTRIKESGGRLDTLNGNQNYFAFDHGIQPKRALAKAPIPSLQHRFPSKKVISDKWW